DVADADTADLTRWAAGAATGTELVRGAGGARGPVMATGRRGLGLVRDTVAGAVAAAVGAVRGAAGSDAGATHTGLAARTGGRAGQRPAAVVREVPAPSSAAGEAGTDRAATQAAVPASGRL